MTRHAGNGRIGRLLRLRAKPAFLPTCDIRGRHFERQLNVDSGRSTRRGEILRACLSLLGDKCLD